jgi:hypothetical protein
VTGTEPWYDYVQEMTPRLAKTDDITLFGEYRPREGFRISLKYQKCLLKFQNRSLRRSGTAHECICGNTGDADREKLQPSQALIGSTSEPQPTHGLESIRGYELKGRSHAMFGASAGEMCGSGAAVRGSFVILEAAMPARGVCLSHLFELSC